MEKDIATQLVEFALQAKYEDIPKEVIDYCKHLTLKTVSGMLAGSAKPSGRKLTRIIKDQKLPKQAGVMGSGFKTALWEAVFLNAYFAHASELEDDRFNGGITWDIGVIPLLFPLAEKLNLSGKAFLESLVAGLEVTVRTGIFSAKHLGLGQVPGAIGPAVAAAKVLGLGAQETAAAVGLAMSSVPLAVVNYGTDAHYFESALMSLQGIMAAEMAKTGLAGKPDLATYLTNFFGKERVVAEKIVEDLGRKWVLCEIWIKKYPCCFLQHRQIDSVIELKKQHNLSYEEVKAIEVHASLAEKICDRPEPKNEGDIQFSFQHVLSAAMLDGDVNLKHISEKAVNDPKLREGRSKVTLIYHPDLTIEFNKAPARVVIKMKDGREFSRERMYPIGHPTHEPLTT
ncbi:MAG: MmgE/PrpD family protein, partial [Deltaproteobacteria bacterium]|nr:MmgE/PrpD family protein [Deltaproteobacteria bacterium]